MAQDTELFARYNYDDVFNRTILVGLLYLLNNELTYDQIWQDNIVENVHVPFMCDFGSSDERFAQDNYTFFGKSCFGDKKIDGKFDMLPRGAVKYTGSQIDASNFTNRFIYARYFKNENGKLTSYTASMSSIPMTFNFEVEMWIDNIITAFKIEQALRATFYKNRRYDVLYKGTKIPCRCGFPENHNLDKTVSYGFDSERQLKLTFSLAVETYQPVFHEGTEIEASKRIENIGWDITMPNNTDQGMYIKFKPFDTTAIYPSGSGVMFEWENASNRAEMCTLSLSWIGNDHIEHTIDTPLFNNGSYIWNIPSDFSGYVAPNVILDDATKVLKQPSIKIVPAADGYINTTSFIFEEPGKYVSGITSLGMTLDYTDKSSKVHISTNYSLNIENGELNLSNPVTVTGHRMKYVDMPSPKRISIKLSYPLDPSISDKIDNILIL